jgi:hypothetical protein
VFDSDHHGKKVATGVYVSRISKQKLQLENESGKLLIEAIHTKTLENQIYLAFILKI